MSIQTPADAFEECARTIWHFELAHVKPADSDEMFLKRRSQMDALRAAGGAALRYGTGKFPDFNELENRIKTVILACVDLQSRPIDWQPPAREAYAFWGDPPFDRDKARKEAADSWRMKECADRVLAVRAALVSLDNVWVTIPPDNAISAEPQAEMAEPEVAQDEQLSSTQIAVLSIIRGQPKGQGINGKKIIKMLKGKGINLAETTLRRHVLPKLKQFNGVVNHRAAGGYLIK